MRIFLDANILFSASLPGSRLRVMLEVLGAKGACLTNTYAIEEARRNLGRKQASALSSLNTLLEKCELVSGLAANLSVAIASKDVPILAGAIVGRADYLLTGDERDFGKFWGQTVQGVKIVSPRMLAEELKL